MLKIRAILLPVLTVCMFMQPFCVHCFAQMRTRTQCADAVDGATCAMVDADSLPMKSKGVCTKKSGLSMPKIELDFLQKAICAGYVFLPIETISSCFPSVVADILFGDDVRCPAWLRFSVLLI